MAAKQKRIKCARCGEREQNALRAQAYRQRKASDGGGALTAPPLAGPRIS